MTMASSTKTGRVASRRPAFTAEWKEFLSQHSSARPVATFWLVLAIMEAVPQVLENVRVDAMTETDGVLRGDVGRGRSNKSDGSLLVEVIEVHLVNQTSQTCVLKSTRLGHFLLGLEP